MKTQKSINTPHHDVQEYTLGDLNNEELSYLNFRRSQDQKHQK